MKIIIKYYNQWGQLQQVPILVSSKGQVLELKKQIQSVTQIEVSKQILTLINSNTKTLLDQDEVFLSDYEITFKSIIFAYSIDDQFSKDSSICASFEEQKCTLLDEEESSYFIQQHDQSQLSQNPFIFPIDNSDQQYEQFFEAVKANNLDLVRQLISPHMVNDTSKYNWSALHLAVFHGFDKLFLFLMSEGGDINLESRDGWDCLSLAIWQKNTTIITILIGQQSLDINKRTKHGTALHIAAQVDDASVMQLLLTHPKISLNVLDNKMKRPVDIAGEETKPLLSWEMSKLDINQQFLETFRLSVSNMIRFSNVSNNSFFVNCPSKPPIIKGFIYKVNYFKLSIYQRYLIVDPDSGAIAFFKTINDAPMNPSSLISLETIDDVRLSKNKWFQMDEFFYIEIQSQNKLIYIALHFKSAARQWYESLRNCVGYAKYVNCKIQKYIDQPNKLEKNIVQLMMEKQNQEIIIEDENLIDQKSHLKKQQEQVKQKYRQSLVSVTEKSNQEEDSKEQRESSCLQLKLKDFEILEHIGRGTFGSVYKALLKTSGKTYALKQQDKEKLIDSNHLKYVKGELNILKQLKHPFLINLHYAFQTHHYLYLVLDYCERGDLSKYMSRGVVLDEFTAKFLISQIILSLEYLHSKNIIYRDLKPENIIVENDGYIKIIDFGLSKEVKSQDFIARSFCGSPAYLSPEIIAGQGTTKSTDIYSVGTILYEMLTGYPPFFCGELKQLLHNIRYQRLTLPPNLSKPAANLLQKLLEKNPEARLGANNISILKKHIFFAEINWEKLLQKKYIPPKLKLRTITEKKSVHNNLQSIQLDKDYDDNCPKYSQIQDWNFAE